MIPRSTSHCNRQKSFQIVSAIMILSQPNQQLSNASCIHPRHLPYLHILPLLPSKALSNPSTTLPSPIPTPQRDQPVSRAMWRQRTHRRTRKRKPAIPRVVDLQAIPRSTADRRRSWKRGRVHLADFLLMLSTDAMCASGVGGGVEIELGLKVPAAVCAWTWLLWRWRPSWTWSIILGWARRRRLHIHHLRLSLRGQGQIPDCCAIFSWRLKRMISNQRRQERNLIFPCPSPYNGCLLYTSPSPRD